MSFEQILEISRELFYTALLVALPALAVSLVIGIVVSIIQTITSIQEQTLTFVPRIIAAGLIFVLTMSWSLRLAVHFTVHMLEHIAEVVQ